MSFAPKQAESFLYRSCADLSGLSEDSFSECMYFGTVVLIAKLNTMTGVLFLRNRFVSANNSFRKISRPSGGNYLFKDGIVGRVG